MDLEVLNWFGIKAFLSEGILRGYKIKLLRLFTLPQELYRSRFK